MSLRYRTVDRGHGPGVFPGPDDGPFLFPFGFLYLSFSLFFARWVALVAYAGGDVFVSPMATILNANNGSDKTYY